MKEKFISSNTTDNIIVQCACLGHCSYIEFYKYDGCLKVNIITDIRKKRDAKKLRQLESRFNLNKKQVNDFIYALNDLPINKLDSYVVQDYINQYGKDLYIQMEYLQPLKNSSKHDMITLMFYSDYKDYAIDRSCFDITLTKSMLKSLIKELSSLFGIETLR